MATGETLLSEYDQEIATTRKFRERVSRRERRLETAREVDDSRRPRRPSREHHRMYAYFVHIPQTA